MHTRSVEQTSRSEAALTSLDSSETTSHPLDRQSRAQHCIHAAVAEAREHVITSMWESGLVSHERRAERMGMCCVSPTVFVEAGRNPVCVPGRCRDRLCPTCQRMRGREVRRKLDVLLSKADSVRLLTLTQPATADTLGAKIDSLLLTFRSLRRRAAWKRHVRGGVCVVEITRGSSGTHWHVHLHALIEGTYWGQASIADEWESVLGTRGIVDIRAVHARHGAARYVTKYAAKGTELGGWPAETINEYAIGVHRRRLLATFGKWAKIDVNRDDEDKLPEPLPRVEVSFGLVAAALESGTIDRRSAAPLLARLGVMWRLLMAPFVGVESVSERDLGGDEIASVVSLMLDVAGVGGGSAPAAASSHVPPRPPDPELFGPRFHV